MVKEPIVWTPSLMAGVEVATIWGIVASVITLLVGVTLNASCAAAVILAQGFFWWSSRWTFKRKIKNFEIGPDCERCQDGALLPMEDLL